MQFSQPMIIPNLRKTISPLLLKTELVQLTGVNGQIIAHKEAEGIEVCFELSGPSAGVYMVRIHGIDGTQQHKVIKN
jgi:hypothetical protein